MTDSITAPVEPDLDPVSKQPRPDDSTAVPPVRRAGRFVSRHAVVLGYVALFAYFATRANDTFLTAGTMRTILDQASVPLILAVGLTVILAAGEFDLSYTATVGLSGGIAVIAMTEQGFPVGCAIVVALVVGALAGLVVGVLVTATTASSFIVTLAVGSVLTGLELALTDNTTIYTGIPTAYADLSRFDILTIRLPVWIALAVVVAGLLVMHRSTFGRHVQAVGGNNLAAFFAGFRSGASASPRSSCSASSPPSPLSS